MLPLPGKPSFVLGKLFLSTFVSKFVRDKIGGIVQRLLQHSSASTTQRYIGIEPQRIENLQSLVTTKIGKPTEMMGLQMISKKISRLK